MSCRASSTAGKEVPSIDAHCNHIGAGNPAGFAALGLKSELLETLAALGYREPTPIQSQAIPHILAGVDLVGQAATGTGKTAAFALPILERVKTEGRPEPLALVLVPTRELAMQVSAAIFEYGHAVGVRTMPIYGGQAIGRQLRTLSRGTHVVVATPGRALDHIRRGTLALEAVQLVVLDEADEMLDMGFAEDLEAILDATPKSRQTVLFSATMPPRIDAIARRHQRDPVRIRLGHQIEEEGAAMRIRQAAYVVARSHKPAALGRILDVETPAAAIVFFHTRGGVDQLNVTLNQRGYRAEALHGGMDQDQRDRVMGRFRKGTTELLLATDVAARGLDIDHLTHVINYDVPSSAESYVHRIGRVGRAGRDGVAITLAEPSERRALRNIERLTKQEIVVERVPTIAELDERRMRQTLAAVRESGHADPAQLERFRSVVETLAGESDLMQVALAAVKLAHAAAGKVEGEQEIPDLSQHQERPRKGRDHRAEARPRRGSGTRFERKNGKGHVSGVVTARIYVGAGSSTGVRPQDLVGAIAGESRLEGTDIGSIKVGDFFSIVEVPARAVDDVVRSMAGTMIKGRKAKVRRFEDSRP